MRPALALSALGVAGVLAVSVRAPAADAIQPQSYMPPGAGAVVVWKSPAQTLDRLETLASQAGSAPPGAEPGWVRATAISQTPELADVDLSRPVWLALMPNGPGAEGQTESPKAILVLPVKGNADTLKASLKDGSLKWTTRGAWLIAVDQSLPAAFLKPHAKPFQLPAAMAKLRAESDLAGNLRLDAYPEIRKMLADDDGASLADAPPVLRPLLEAVRGVQSEEWDQIERFSFGAGLATDGLHVFGQAHPKAKSEAAARGRAWKNTESPILTGLPPEDYVAVIGSNTPPEVAASVIPQYLTAMLKASEGLDPEIKKKVEEGAEIAKSAPKCGHMSLGLLMRGSFESLELLSTHRCASSDAMLATNRKWVAWAEGVLQLAAKSGDAPGDAPRVQAKLQKGALEVAKTKFDVAQLSLPPELERDAGEIAQVLERPLVFGAVDPRTTAVGWNVEQARLERLVQASRKNAPLDAPASMVAARKSLLSPRHTEGYLFAGPLVSAAGASELAGMLGPLRVLLAQMPPMALASQTQPDGSHLYQLFLPQQLAQLIAAVAQMQQR